MSIKELLHFQSQIHPQVLKVTCHPTQHSSSEPSLPYSSKQTQFQQTCLAISSIIKQKLYKLSAPNLEQYFLREFNVSRAQVYRLLDCGVILKSLTGLNPLPHKYKVCKDLKQKAGTGLECRILWEKIISTCMTEEQIDGYPFESLPDFKRCDERLQPPMPCAPLGVKRKMSVPTVDGNRLPPLKKRGSISLQGPSIKPVDPTKTIPDAMTVEGELKKCREAMTNLANRGYQLSPFIDGVWRHDTISEWRILPRESEFEDVDSNGDSVEEKGIDKLKELVRIAEDL